MLRRHCGGIPSPGADPDHGGAVGNVIDRVRYGVVVDFIQWHVAGFYWPSFNLADSAICVGAALMIWDQFRAKPLDGEAVEHKKD